VTSQLRQFRIFATVALFAAATPQALPAQQVVGQLPPLLLKLAAPPAAAEARLIAQLPRDLRRELTDIALDVRGGAPVEEVQPRWKSFVHRAAPADSIAQSMLVTWMLREAYPVQLESLRTRAALSAWYRRERQRIDREVAEVDAALSRPDEVIRGSTMLTDMELLAAVPPSAVPFARPDARNASEEALPPGDSLNTRAALHAYRERLMIRSGSLATGSAAAKSALEAELKWQAPVLDRMIMILQGLRDDAAGA
jgi:hypothetical protein